MLRFAILLAALNLSGTAHSKPLDLGHGLAASVSPDGREIVFSRYHPEVLGAPTLRGENDGTGTFQLYLASPTGENARCITCADIKNGPRKDQHKHVASYHPGGEWLIAAVEMPKKSAPHGKTHGGTGAYVDIYALSRDGARWVQLTRYSRQATKPRFEEAPVGALVPRLSRDGRVLVWAEMIGYDAQHPFGIWRLAHADFIVDPRTGPRLANVKTYAPGGKATFYEPWSFFPGDKELLVASEGSDGHPGVMDIHVWNPATGTFKDLTASMKEYEEQALVSPDGRRIAFMTTRGQNPSYNPQKAFWETFRTDVWLMDKDGGNPRRLTNFNSGKDGAPVLRAIPTAWSNDGKFLYVEVATNVGSAQKHDQAKLYRVPVPD